MRAGEKRLITTVQYSNYKLPFSSRDSMSRQCLSVHGHLVRRPADETSVATRTVPSGSLYSMLQVSFPALLDSSTPWLASQAVTDCDVLNFSDSCPLTSHEAFSMFNPTHKTRQLAVYE